MILTFTLIAPSLVVLVGSVAAKDMVSIATAAALMNTDDSFMLLSVYSGVNEEMIISVCYLI